jgi:hypothetical protein
VLDHEVVLPSVRVQRFDTVAEQMACLRRDLSNFCDGVEPAGAETVAAFEQARALLEALYDQHLTLHGEAGRARTGTPLDGQSKEPALSKVVASGRGAVAAFSMNGPVATTGGVATSGGISGIHVSPDDST